MKKVIETVCVIVMTVCFFLVIGIVGGNEQGTISNANTIIWSLVVSAAIWVSGWILSRLEKETQK